MKKNQLSKKAMLKKRNSLIAFAIANVFFVAQTAFMFGAIEVKNDTIEGFKKSIEFNQDNDQSLLINQIKSSDDEKAKANLAKADSLMAAGVLSAVACVGMVGTSYAYTKQQRAKEQQIKSSDDQLEK